MSENERRNDDSTRSPEAPPESHETRPTGAAAPPVAVRRAVAGDAAMLAALGERTFVDAFGRDNTPEDMAVYLASAFGESIQAAEIAAPDSTFFVAEIGGEPAGYARIAAGPAPPCVAGERPVEIVRVYALSAWHGRGVGEALMRACVDAAGAGGYDAVWLGVWERNERAKAFYRKWGFEDVGVKTFVLGADVQYDRIMRRGL